MMYKAVTVPPEHRQQNQVWDGETALDQRDEAIVSGCDGTLEILNRFLEQYGAEGASRRKR